MLLALFVCLVPVVFFVNRDATPSDDVLREKVARDDRAYLDTKIPAVVLSVETSPKEGY